MTDKPDVKWVDAPVWRDISCGPGWWPIIAELDSQLRERFPGYGVVQVKEKFGALSYYVEGVPFEEYELILAAQKESAQTCEECGAPGTLRDNRRWFKTLCDGCAAERDRFFAELAREEGL